VIPALLGLLAALVPGALVPGPWRDGARTGLVFYALFSPLLALAAFLSTRDVEPGAWLLFLPLGIAWCIALDLTFGVSRRLSRRRGRGGDR
jgi:peptidoglycan/LPS O-acetylase OafA/YrhL